MSSALCWRTLFIGLLVVGIFFLVRLAFYYRDSYHHALDTQREFLQLAEARQKTIIDMQARQRVVADIDAKYTQELANANEQIEKLRADVASGHKRLRIAATCPKMSRGTATARLDDGVPPPRLTDAAQSDYFTLSNRIETTRSQLAGLQDYIRHVCLAPKIRGVL